MCYYPRLRWLLLRVLLIGICGVIGRVRNDNRLLLAVAVIISAIVAAGLSSLRMLFLLLYNLLLLLLMMRGRYGGQEEVIMSNDRILAQEIPAGLSWSSLSQGSMPNFWR